jgi:hypothetical protein
MSAVACHLPNLRLCIASGAIALWVCAPLAAAQSPAPPSSGAESVPSALPSPTIPAPQPTALSAPDPSSVRELDELLSKVVGDDESVRKEALSELGELDASVIAAIEQKLANLRKSADRDGMSKILGPVQHRRHASSDGDDARASDKGGADGGAKDKRKSKERDEDEDKQGASVATAGDHKLIDPNGADWLAAVLTARAERDKPPFKDLVAILAMQRVCVCIGTTPAAREIINVYTYFGDLFRIDVQRQLGRMGERALPALIEAKYHDSRMVRGWAERRLDAMGKVIASEAVRTDDNQVLADVLRAYGRVREVEAVRVIVTYANSDRLQVREAAREAIGQLGEPARWQLRDAYENLTGRKAETGWDWRRTAIELFAAYDRARLAEVYKMAEDGFAAYKKGQLPEAIDAFDKVLARVPMFERRAEMVAAYLQQAQKLYESDPPAALSALRRAELLDPGGPLLKSIQSQQALLEAQELSSRGVVDVTLLQRALELDPSNQRAQVALQRAQHDIETRQAAWRRYAAAIAIGVIALAAMVFVALAPRRGAKRERQDPQANG